MQDDDVEDDEVEDDDVEEDDVEEDDVEEEDRDPHFVRTWAIEMHLHMSQGPFCAEIQR